MNIDRANVQRNKEILINKEKEIKKYLFLSKGSTLLTNNWSFISLKNYHNISFMNLYKYTR